MEKFSLFSENQIHEWFLDLKTMYSQSSITELTLDRRHLLTESEVADFFRVSDRTMRTYRHKEYLHYIKMEGQIYYLQLLLFYDLFALSKKRNR